jgi:hypothetical protein
MYGYLWPRIPQKFEEMAIVWRDFEVKLRELHTRPTCDNPNNSSFRLLVVVVGSALVAAGRGTSLHQHKENLPFLHSQQTNSGYSCGGLLNFAHLFICFSFVYALET